MSRDFAPTDIQRLLALMARLRDPERGCPWDREQTFASIAPYTIEEAYEVADAIERHDLPSLRDELGDLLFQVVFHSRLAAEQGAFTFEDVVRGICEKMERRHPHVFGTERIESAAEQTIAWEEHKRRERGAKQSSSVLHDVPVGLPGLTRAMKLGKRTSSVGFDWHDSGGAFDKVEEELREIRSAVEMSAPLDHVTEEIGDVLFGIANVCRHLKIDPEEALRKTNAKFERRFGHIETRLAQQGRTPSQATLEEMDKLWDEAKAKERE
jgi:MazG family protein